MKDFSTILKKKKKRELEHIKSTIKFNNKTQQKHLYIENNTWPRHNNARTPIYKNKDPNYKNKDPYLENVENMIIYYETLLNYIQRTKILTAHKKYHETQ